MTRRPSRDAFGSVLGILVFLGGLALLLVVFRLAYGMFQTPPDRALDLRPGEAIDLNRTGSTLVGLLLRVLLLLVMGIVASLVANRGITLFVQASARAKTVEKGRKDDA